MGFELVGSLLLGHGCGWFLVVWRLVRSIKGAGRWGVQNPVIISYMILIVLLHKFVVYDINIDIYICECVLLRSTMTYAMKMCFLCVNVFCF